MQRDCNRCKLNCADLVRRYLDDNNTDEDGKLQARNRLVVELQPLIRKIVFRVIRDESLREEAAQDVTFKLCDPKVVRTWDPYRAKFCSWLRVVVVHMSYDLLRKEKPFLRKQDPESVLPQYTLTPAQQVLQKEESNALQKSIHRYLSKFPVLWQLIFFMRHSYTEPDRFEIMAATNLKKTAVYDHYDDICEKIQAKVGKDNFIKAAQVEPVGERHPLENYERLESEQQEAANHEINAILLEFDIKEQAVFFMKYSPLTAEDKGIAEQLKLTEKEVREILQRIGLRLQAHFGPDAL